MENCWPATRSWSRSGSLASLYYELASDMTEGCIAVASHKLIQIMKVLAVVMAICLPLSCLAGIYGMKVDSMPKLHSRFGDVILLRVMGVIASILLVVLRKKRGLWPW